MEVTSKYKFSYNQFINWVRQLVNNKATSGNNQSDTLIDFTALNLKRMERIEKTITLNNELLNALKATQKQKWIVITEAWCGDSAQILPIIGLMAQASNNNIELEIILRDENPEWINNYLTNGSKSIPKLISRNIDNEDIFVWGPRPAEAQKIVVNWKEGTNGKNWYEMETELHGWYAKDKAKSIMFEIFNLLKQLPER